MSVPVILGLALIAVMLFMAFRPTKRLKADPTVPGDFSGTQDGGASAYGNDGGSDGGAD